MANPWKITCAALTVGLVASLAVPAIREARAAQPHMVAAHKALTNALADLKSADPDKGGHRAAAITACETAIAETQKGIDAAK